MRKRPNSEAVNSFGPALSEDCSIPMYLLEFRITFQVAISMNIPRGQPGATEPQEPPLFSNT